MSNLQFLFAGKNEQPFKNSKILDGKVTVFKRPSSKVWQCRFKLSNGVWHTTTTGTDDLAQARIQAVAIYETTKIKLDAGLAVSSRTFKQLALEELANMTRALNASVGKTTYIDYTQAINKYLIPFFGKYEIDKITTEVIADFESWRTAEMGKVPKASTKQNHASAYNRVIALARNKGIILQTKAVPLLDARGAKSVARPAFNEQEIDAMLTYIPIWQKSSYTERTAQMRVLCAAYVEFLLNTGVRHSTESLPLRWKHLQWHWIGTKKYLRIWVSGKTGPRFLIAKHEVIDVFERLITWQCLPYDSLNAVIDAKLDRLIFRLPTGEKLSNMENIFRNLMIRSKLRDDPSGLHRTLYSLRHTYATLALAKGVDIHTLARQMGTSVKMIESHYSKLTPMMSAEELAN